MNIFFNIMYILAYVEMLNYRAVLSTLKHFLTFYSL